jgi:hypothetical protein
LRKSSGMRTIRNAGEETQMRQKLAAAVTGVVQHANGDVGEVTEDEIKQILNAADITTMA